MKAILSLLSRVLRLFFWVTICAAGLGAAMGQTPEVANVTIAQRAGTKLVDVRYDLTGAEGQTYVVKVEASRDGGSVFEEVSALSGAVGQEVTPGAGKTVVWDAGADWPVQRFDAVRVRVTATSAAQAEVGTVNGLVRDAITGTGLSGVSLRFFSTAGELTGITGATGNYSREVAAGPLRITISRPGYVTTNVFVTVEANAVVEADAVLFAEERAGNGTISGRVVNAFDASGVGGATLRLRAGVNAVSGPVVQTVTAAGNGTYTLLAPSGNYTLEASANSFTTGYANVVAVGGVVLANQDVRLTPGLAANEVRVVLTWGASPADLDSHLAGPRSGGGTFHAYYSEPQPAGSSVALDVDDTSSYGPETITISESRAGTYRYWVHDYSNRNSATSAVLSQQSGAKVIVYRGTGAGTVKVAEYNAPTGRTGNAWVVFELNGATGVITPINTVINVAGSSTVP